MEPLENLKDQSTALADLLLRIPSEGRIPLLIAAVLAQIKIESNEVERLAQLSAALGTLIHVGNGPVLKITDAKQLERYMTALVIGVRHALMPFGIDIRGFAGQRVQETPEKATQTQAQSSIVH